MTPVQLQQTEAGRRMAGLTPPSTLRREIEAVMGLAERADLHRAVDWIERRWAQEHPSREWVLGACVWCGMNSRTFHRRRFDVMFPDAQWWVWLLAQTEPADVESAEGEEFEMESNTTNRRTR